MSGRKPQGAAGERPEEERPVSKEAEAGAESLPGEPRKKSPLFRMSRLDGRDTLKYEDTADK
jgi:hypothetical protein